MFWGYRCKEKRTTPRKKSKKVIGIAQPPRRSPRLDNCPRVEQRVSYRLIPEVTSRADVAKAVGLDRTRVAQIVTVTWSPIAYHSIISKRARATSWDSSFPKRTIDRLDVFIWPVLASNHPSSFRHPLMDNLSPHIYRKMIEA